MPSNGSKKFHVTLSAVEGNEIEEIATERGVPAAQIIRERLNEWQPQTSTQENIAHIDLSDFTIQLQQLTEQLTLMRDSVEQLGDRSTQPDPQIRALLQPVHTRLQQVETQVGVMGNLTQQMVQQIGKHQLRLEAWLEAVYVIVQPLLTDNQLEEVQHERQKWIKELQQRLEQHLEAHQ
jgi:Mg2+ and Co2+ transporter CorA